jgi:Uma2 family endonuclease
LRLLLEQAAGSAGVVETEVGYRPVPEHQYWEADVAFLSHEQWDRPPDNGYLEQPPKLVVEILSPSNTKADIRSKKKLYLENGCEQFWIVDDNRRAIEVSTPDGRTIVYKSGDRIPLFFAAGANIEVDAIFAASD